MPTYLWKTANRISRARSRQEDASTRSPRRARARARPRMAARSRSRRCDAMHSQRICFRCMRQRRMARAQCLTGTTVTSRTRRRERGRRSSARAMAGSCNSPKKQPEPQAPPRRGCPPRRRRFSYLRGMYTEGRGRRCSKRCAGQRDNCSTGASGTCARRDYDKLHGATGYKDCSTWARMTALPVTVACG